MKEQISGTAIGTKCAPSYACIFMDEFETKFIESQQNKLLVWFRYIDYIFFSSGLIGKKSLNHFWKILINLSLT